MPCLFQHHPPLRVLVVGQIPQGVPGRCRAVTDPAPRATARSRASATLELPRCISAPTETSPRPRVPPGPAAPGSKSVEPGEVEDVAQFAQLVVA